MQPPSISELQAELSRHFGFQVPEAFGQFIQHGIIESSKEGFFDYWTFFNYFHFFDFNMPVNMDYDTSTEKWTYTPNEKYEDYYCYGLPPELCMFGSIDSLRFGYIVHDPDLEMKDYPVGKVAEMDIGVISYGNNTVEGLENLVAVVKYKYRHFGQENESYAIEAKERGEVLGKLFNFNADKEIVVAQEEKTYDAGERILRAVPVIPEGWHYEPSSDGIGVLAPAAQFAPEKITEPEDTKEIKKAIKNGYYATALLALRETLWKNWHSNSDPFYEECAVLMQKVYKKMGRSKYAERVGVQIKYMKSLNF
jgi:hypothetical protein